MKTETPGHNPPQNFDGEGPRPDRHSRHWMDTAAISVGLIVGATVAAVFLAGLTLDLAGSRTDGVPVLQIIAVMIGVPGLALWLTMLAIFRGVRMKDAAWSLAVLGVLFTLVAFCHVRYSKQQKLEVGGIEILIESNNLDAGYTNFYARWKTKGGRWSEREQIGWSFDHQPPFRAKSVGEGMVEIIDQNRKMSSVVGPRARHAPYGSRWRDQRR